MNNQNLYKQMKHKNVREINYEAEKAILKALTNWRNGEDKQSMLNLILAKKKSYPSSISAWQVLVWS